MTKRIAAAILFSAFSLAGTGAAVTASAAPASASVVWNAPGTHYYG